MPAGQASHFIGRKITFYKIYPLTSFRTSREKQQSMEKHPQSQ